MDNGGKNATRILTTNDIREGAQNWTLAGDVGLLAHLEQFSENIISKSEETQKHFTELFDDFEELYTKVGNVTNQFLALQNCQFVENRVYDEETPTEEKEEIKVLSEVEQEKLLLKQYKEAVEVGIKLLDTHFQEVQLPPNSDSDEDDDEVSAGNSIVWKPKNPYAEKKFPLLIGSAEWWADDHVGLEPEEDILDTEKIVSDSETDLESLKSFEKEAKSISSSSMENVKSTPNKPAFLGSSSEDLFGLEKNENLKKSVSDDLFFKQTDDFLPDFDKETETETEAKKRRDSLGDDQPHVPEQDDGEEKPSAVIPSKKVDNAFTRELMAKLSSVSSGKEVKAKAMEKEKDKEKETTRARRENLFDETDDSSDLFSARTPDRGEGSASSKEARTLFHDLENDDDDLFKGENDLFSERSLFESDEQKTPMKRSVAGAVPEVSKESLGPLKPTTESIMAKKNVINNLFDDLEDDDTLFATKQSEHTPTNKSFSSVETIGDLKKAKSDITSGLVLNSDDALFEDSRSAPVDDDLFNSPAVTSVEERSTKADLNLFPKEPRKEHKSEIFGNIDQKSSLFESNSSPKISSVKELTDDSFGLSAPKKSILDLEDDDDDNDDDDLFSKSFRNKGSSLKVNTFVDGDNDAALFGDPPKPSDAVSMSSSRSSLFDDASVSKSWLASVFEKDKGGIGGGEKGEEDLFRVSEDSLFAGEEKRLTLGKEKLRGEKVGERSSLFGECDDDDDLFGGERSSRVRDEEPNKTIDGTKVSVGSLVDDSEDDLFKVSRTPTKLRETKSDILQKSERKLFVDDDDDADLFSAAATTKPKPPSSLRLKDTESEIKDKAVGKLNIPENLKVRFESVARRISPGSVKPSTEEKEEKNEREEEKKDELDEPPSASNLLKCPSKDRVKIPGRRRPQSRRARQEALRASGTWDQPAAAPLSSPSAPNTLSNPLSPSTDEEDFFKVPELDTNFEKEDQSIFKNDLFDSSKSSKAEESLLFDGAPVLSPLGSREKSGKPKPDSLFFDDDLNVSDEDYDSLFKSPKPLGGQLPSKGSEEKPKKSLFLEESDNDDDDLFGEKSTAVVTTLAKPPHDKENNGKGKEKEKEKQKDSSTFVDPLGLYTKN